MAASKGKGKDREPRPITINLTINLFESPSQGGVNDEEYGEIMAKIDEVQASFDELDSAIREMLASLPSGVSAIQAELDALRADDAIEDTKLDGLQNGIGNLVGVITAFRDRADEVLPGGDLPYPDQSLPGDQPRPDQTLPGDLPQQ